MRHPIQPVFLAGRDGLKLRWLRGLSLLEVLVAIGIAAALILVAIPTFKVFARKTSKAVCMNNLRQLHVAFSTYIQDVGHWPQMPEGVDSNEQSYEKWWITTMKPYGATEKLWICPVLKAAKLKDPSGRPIKMHYIPTQFDANRISPTRWPGQPWLIERGNAHGGGSLIIFPDGSIKGLDEILKNK